MVVERIATGMWRWNKDIMIKEKGCVVCHLQLEQGFLVFVDIFVVLFCGGLMLGGFYGSEFDSVSLA